MVTGIVFPRACEAANSCIRGPSDQVRVSSGGLSTAITFRGGSVKKPGVITKKCPVLLDERILTLVYTGERNAPQAHPGSRKRRRGLGWRCVTTPSFSGKEE